MKRSSPLQSITAPEGEETGLSWLPTWKGIYLVVILHFVLWIILLVALTDFFS
jgi:hypothetical protein